MNKCKQCGKYIERKVYNGKIEGEPGYQKRKCCSAKCAGLYKQQRDHP